MIKASEKLRGPPLSNLGKNPWLTTPLKMGVQTPSSSPPFALRKGENRFVPLGKGDHRGSIFIGGGELESSWRTLLKS